MSWRSGATFARSSMNGKRTFARHPVMSETQIRAYLVARETLRRISRTSSYLEPARARDRPSSSPVRADAAFGHRQ